jgi:virginiamycin B lyase
MRDNKHSRSSRPRLLAAAKPAIVATLLVAALVIGAWPASAATATITEFPTIFNAGPWGIAAGSDGNLWFTEALNNSIGRISPAGAITEFPVPVSYSGSGLEGIAAGPDGNLWFADSGASKIGRITPAGVVTEFVLSALGQSPLGMVAGPDGNMWFLEGVNNVGRITTSGVVTEFPIPTPFSAPAFITAGPDGNLWFTEAAAAANKIGRITQRGRSWSFQSLLHTALRSASRRDRTATCGSPSRLATRSGGLRPRD